MDEIKLLIIGNYAEGKGGISGVISNHYQKLRQEGCQVDIFNTKRHNLIRLFLLLPLIVRLRKYNIIHIHGCSYMGFYPIVLGLIASKWIYHKTTVVTYHGGGAKDFLSKRQRFVRFFLKKADEVTVMSPFLQDIFTAFNIPTVILPNLVDIEVRRDNEVDFTIPKLISLRSLSSIYNIHDIISAYEIVLQNNPKTELTIAGSGEKQAVLKEQAESIQNANITFLGHISNLEIQTILSQANIMISVPSFDNQPMSILEAFACGTLVISSNAGGVPYMIQDGVNGLLVDAHRPEQVAKKIIWVMNHPEERRQIIENAKKAIKQYQWHNIKEQLLQIYKFSKK